MDLSVTRRYSISQEDENEQFSDEDQLNSFRSRKYSINAKKEEEHNSLGPLRENVPTENLASKDMPQSKGIAISDEIKKMGLTANPSYYILDDEKFLIKNIRKTNCKKNDKTQADNVSDVHVSTFLSKKINQIFDLPSNSTSSPIRIRHLSEEHKERTKLNNSHDKQIMRRPHSAEDMRKKCMNSQCEHRNEDRIGKLVEDKTDFKTSSGVDIVIPESDNQFQNISDIQPAKIIFARNDGLKRISSASCLKRIQDRLKVIPDLQTEEEILVLNKEKGTCLGQRQDLRRIHSTSDIENFKAPDKEDKIRKDQRYDKGTVEDGKILEANYNDKSDLHQHTHDKHSKSKGIMKWMKTNKIRQSKREITTLSPNAF